MSDTVDLTRRTVTLAAPVDEAALEIVRAVDGVARVRLLSDHQLELAYDADRVGLEDLERLMSRSGVTLAGGFFTRLRRWLAAFQEANRRDQSQHMVHHCCNQAPDDE